MIKAIADRPWIWIVAAWAVLIAVLAVFVFISVKYRDKEVPIPQQKVAY